MSKLSLLVALLLTGIAYAQDGIDPAPLKGHVVTITLRDGSAHTGTLAAYDAQTLVVIEVGTGHVLPLPRADVMSAYLCTPIAPSSSPVNAVQPLPIPLTTPPAPPAKARHVGLAAGLTGPGNLMLDVEVGRVYGFVATSIGYPIIFSGDQAQYLSAAVGLGGTWKIGPLWHFDLMGITIPTYWGGFAMGIGIAAGFHYTSPSGFTFGVKIPVLGVAPGYSSIFGNDDSGNVTSGANLIGNFFLQAAMVSPTVTVGYRF